MVDKVIGLVFLVIAFASVIMHGIYGDVSFAVSTWGAIIMSKLFFDA